MQNFLNEKTYISATLLFVILTFTGDYISTRKDVANNEEIIKKIESQYVPKYQFEELKHDVENIESQYVPKYQFEELKHDVENINESIKDQSKKFQTFKDDFNQGINDLVILLKR